MKSKFINEKDVMFALQEVKNRAIESKDYLSYIIHCYNNQPEVLTAAECLWLEKYLPRNGKYCVVLIEGNEKIILKEEADAKGYEILEYEKRIKRTFTETIPMPETKMLTRKELENFINNDLLRKGFERVYDTDKEIILFNKNRNIVLYVEDKDKFVDGYFVYQQPELLKNGTIWLKRFNNVNNCSKDLISFPKFNLADYLKLSTPFSEEFKQYQEYFHEAPLTNFYLSMKKIAQIPVLMEAIGEENREIVYNTLNLYNEQEENYCIKK